LRAITPCRRDWQRGPFDDSNLRRAVLACGPFDYATPLRETMPTLGGAQKRILAILLPMTDFFFDPGHRVPRRPVRSVVFLIWKTAKSFRPKAANPGESRKPVYMMDGTPVLWTRTAQNCGPDVGAEIGIKGKAGNIVRASNW